MKPYHFEPIGFIQTPFTEKFGIPRQSLMATEAKGIIKLKEDPGYRVALNHLEGFSHLWVIFVFHQNGSLESEDSSMSWRSTIRPPREDAPRRVGVFASRSPHRPNPIGMSAVKLEKIDLDSPGGIEIHCSGVDLLNGTPVLDIKPYVPFADKIENATSGWAESEIPKYRVDFSDQSLKVISDYEKKKNIKMIPLLTQILEWDPRPTSQRRAMPISDPSNSGLSFGFRIFDHDLQWQIKDQKIFVTQFVAVETT